MGLEDNKKVFGFIAHVLDVEREFIDKFFVHWHADETGVRVVVVGNRMAFVGIGERGGRRVGTEDGETALVLVD